MAKPKDFLRLDMLAREDRSGRLFVDPGTAAIVDLSKVRLLRCGVDTVRQLYRGLIRPEIMALFGKPGAMVEWAGTRATSTSSRTPTSGSCC